MKTILIALIFLSASCFGQDFKVQKGKHRLYVYDSLGNIGSIKLKQDRSAYKHFEVLLGGGYQSNSLPIGFKAGHGYSSGSGINYGASIGTFVSSSLSVGLDYSNQFWGFGYIKSKVNIYSAYLSKHIGINKSEIDVSLKVGYVLWNKSLQYGKKYDVSGVGGGISIAYRYNISNKIFAFASFGANRARVVGSVNNIGYSAVLRPTLEYSLYYFPAFAGIGFRF